MDKNWLKTHIEVKSGGFIRAFESDLTKFDFNNLKEDLNILYNNLNEEIVFKDLEGYLVLIFIGDNTGNLTIHIICIDRLGIYSNDLKEMNFDEAYLKTLVKIFDNFTKQFPIFGDFNN